MKWPHGCFNFNDCFQNIFGKLQLRQLKFENNAEYFGNLVTCFVNVNLRFLRIR